VITFRSILFRPVQITSRDMHPGSHAAWNTAPRGVLAGSVVLVPDHHTHRIEACSLQRRPGMISNADLDLDRRDVLSTQPLRE
jgi:hypothetical protein